MAKTANFEKITDGITQADIDRFLRSTAPEDVKKQVRESPDQRTKMRFVAGYLIRTNQVPPEKPVSRAGVKKSALKTTSTAARRVRPATATAGDTTAGDTT